MSIQSLFTFFNRSKCNAENIANLCGAAGLYAIAGTLFSITSPWTAAAYGLTTILNTRVVLWTLNKYPWDPTDIAAQITIFVSAFFTGSALGAFLTNSMGLTISFTTGILLHGAILAIVSLVTAIALACLLSMGACISVHSLPE